MPTKAELEAENDALRVNLERAREVIDEALGLEDADDEDEEEEEWKRERVACAIAQTTRGPVTRFTAAATARDETEMPANIDSPSLERKSPEALMSVKDAATYLGISVGWLYGSG